MFLEFEITEYFGKSMYLLDVGQYLLREQKVPGKVERITCYNSFLMLSCILSTRYTNTLFTAVLCTKEAQKAETLFVYMNMKKTDANIIGNKEKATALILLRKVICKSSHLNGRTGRPLCDGRTFRLWRNSEFLSTIYSQAVEFQYFWIICAPKKVIDRTDMNSSYLDLILHSWK